MNPLVFAAKDKKNPVTIATGFLKIYFNSYPSATLLNSITFRSELTDFR
jgi:hypothetical protein